jgi:probable phosphoglycerate mutase
VTRGLALVLALGLAASAAGVDDELARMPALPAGATRVYLVRHAQALSNLDPAPALGAAELDHLTELGRRQAEAAGRALSGGGATSVLSSPAARARETAAAVARVLALDAPGVESRLRPMALGHGADGRPLTWKERGAEWEAGRDARPKGGESLEDVAERIQDLVRGLGRSRRGASLVLVAHAEVIAAYLGRVRGTPAAKRYPFSLVNGSISVVDVLPTGSETLRVVNYAPASP